MVATMATPVIFHFFSLSGFRDDHGRPWPGHGRDHGRPWWKTNVPQRSHVFSTISEFVIQGVPEVSYYIRQVRIIFAGVKKRTTPAFHTRAERARESESTRGNDIPYTEGVDRKLGASLKLAL